MSFASHDDAYPFGLLATPIWIFDLERHRYWWGNRSALEFWAADDLAALQAHEVVPAPNELLQRLLRFAAAGGPEDMVEESWTLCPHVMRRAVTARLTPARIEEGRPALLCEMTRVIDMDGDPASVRMLEATKVSPLMISSFSPDGRLMVQNPAAAAVFAATRPDPKGEIATLFDRIVDPEMIRRLLSVVQTNAALKADAEVHTAAGRRWHRLTATRAHDPETGGLALVIAEDDITAVRLAETAVRRIRAAVEARSREEARLSAARLRAAIEAIPDGFSLFDADGRLVLFNSRYAETIGFGANAPAIGRTLEEMLRASVAEGVAAEAVGREEEWIAERMERYRNPRGAFEQQLSDGRWLRIDERRTPDGETVGLRGDITALKNMQTALEHSEGRFRDYAFSAADWFWETDAEFRFTHLTENVERIIGIPAEWHYGKTPKEMLGEIYDEEAWAAHEAVLRAHEPFRNFEYLRNVEGYEPRWLRISGVPFFDRHGEFAGYRGAALDVTRSKLAQERLLASEAQLYQAQKMEAVGQLTGGIAHDFNNMLAVVQGNLELLEEAVTDPNLREMVEAALRASSRGARTAGQLLAFGRRVLLKPVAMPLNEQLGAMGAMLRLTLPPNILIETDYAPDTWPLELDPGQFEAAVLNIAINARDAMPEGGALRISTGNLLVGDDERPPGTEALAPGRYLVVTISDTGSGMDAATMAKAFEPFFTTKPIGEGSGLGLSMVHGFVHQSGGSAAIASAPGAGTTVRLYFPAASQSDVVAIPTDRLSPAPPGGGETIVVVDDDEGVRRAVSTQLRGLGYKVIEARDGADALAVLQSGDRIDVLLTDMILPGELQGGEIGRIGRELRPGLKVVFMSGLPSTFDAEPPGIRPGDLLLTKPVSKGKLARSIWKVLNEGSEDDETVRPGA